MGWMVGFRPWLDGYVMVDSLRSMLADRGLPWASVLFHSGGQDLSWLEGEGGGRVRLVYILWGRLCHVMTTYATVWLDSEAGN